MIVRIIKENKLVRNNVMFIWFIYETFIIVITKSDSDERLVDNN